MSGIFQSLRKFGSGILSGLGKVGSGVLGGLSRARDFIKSGYDKVSKIPVLGSAVKELVNLPLIDGMSVSDIAGKASEAIDRGQQLKSAIEGRDIDRGAEALKGLRRLRGGGK
jgi:hypothetical protein